jgi:RNA polymerase sigma factor (TIGR02999 family)
LQRVARGALRGERAGHTLQAQALLHEAYVRLMDTDVDWRDRGHFLAVVARTMRRVLVDHGRARGRAKRDGGVRVTLTGPIEARDRASSAIDVLVLSSTIDRLAAMNERQAQIVELHLFGGLTHAETATALGVSIPTIERDARLARAWLRRELTPVSG